MRIQVQIGGTDVLLTPEQMETIYNILSDGAEVIDLKYRGDGKGSWGRDLTYDAEFVPFDASQHGQSVKVVPEQVLDKHKTLAEYRKQGELK